MTEKQEILALDQRRRRAMIEADVSSLEGLFNDELLWIHGNGRIDSKPGILNTIGSGKTKYRSIECSEESVRLFGSVAAVSGVADMQVEIAGEKRTLNNRFTILWAQQSDGLWQVVNWQSTSLPKA